MRFGNLAIAMLMLSTSGTVWAGQEAAVPTQALNASTHNVAMPQIEHMAVWTEDLKKTAKFLNDTLGWKLHPIEFGVSEDDKTFGGMDLAFVDANGLWLELIQPTTPGPGMDLLKEKGKGALVELDFAVPNLDKATKRLKSMGIDAVGMDGKPMQNGGLLTEWVLQNGKRVDADERLAYIPNDATLGTQIELFWEYPNGALFLRDAMWEKAGLMGLEDGPRLDHTVVLAADIKKSTAVYTDVVGLPLAATANGVRSDWMGVGDASHSWIMANDKGFRIQVVAAPQTPAGAALLKKFGVGNIMELAVEVPSIDAFYDQMKAKGIVMTAGNGGPLPKGKKAMPTDTSGIRYNYFPLDKSEGMRIMVYQRAGSEK